jgi:uncharacterized protein YndB with AHSA1/START domain
MNKARREVELYIRTTPPQLWAAITQPEQTRQYWYGALNHSTWTPGARWTSESEDGEVYLEGEIVEIEAPSLLVHTFHVAHEEEAAAEAPSTVSWEITPMGDACRLMLVHDGLGKATLDYVTGGWELILSGMKTWLETGQPLKVGEPSVM